MSAGKTASVYIGSIVAAFGLSMMIEPKGGGDMLAVGIVFISAPIFMLVGYLILRNR